MSRSVHVPAGIFDGLPYGFAQVAIVPTPFGNAVHVSGQVAWDADQSIVGAGDLGRQLEKSLDNLAVALGIGGCETRSSRCAADLCQAEPHARRQGHQWRSQGEVRRQAAMLDLDWGAKACPR